MIQLRPLRWVLLSKSACKDIDNNAIKWNIIGCCSRYQTIIHSPLVESNFCELDFLTARLMLEVSR